MSYQPHEALVAPARSSAALWRLLAGAVATTALYILLGSIALGFGSGVMTGVYGRPDGLDMLLAADTPLAVCIWLFSFVTMILSLVLPMRLLHGRRVLALIGDLPLALHQFLRVLVALLVLNAVLILLPTPDFLQLSLGLDPSRWLMVLPLALAGLVIQVTAEELVFRGYLQSQLAARFAHPGVWLVVPTVIFGLLHYAPETAGKNAGLLVVATMAFGLAAADLTARAGTLGPAIALHLVNNVIAILLVANAGMLDGMALWQFDADLTDGRVARAIVMLDVMVIFCSWLAARLALRR